MLKVIDYIRAHQYLYYVIGLPILHDSDYDRLGVWSGLDYKGGSDSASAYTTEQITLAISSDFMVHPFPSI